MHVVIQGKKQYLPAQALYCANFQREACLNQSGDGFIQNIYLSTA